MKLKRRDFMKMCGAAIAAPAALLDRIVIINSKF